MTAADLRMLADMLDRLEVGGFVVALELGELTIRARPAPASAAGEPFSDGTRFTDGTAWVEQSSESSEP